MKTRSAVMQGWGGLRSRLVLLVLVALLPVFGLFAYSAAQQQRAALALAESNLQSQALLAATGQRHLVERVSQLLADITSGPSIKDTRIRLCVPYLRNLQAKDPFVTDLGVFDLQGKLSCHANAEGNDLSAADRSYFQQVLAGKSFSIGEFAVGRTSGRPSIGFGMPVFGPDEALNGVAFAAVDTGAIAGVLAENRVAEGAHMRVLDRRGVVLASQPPETGLAGTPEKDANLLDALRAARPGVRKAEDASGAQRLYAYAPVSGTGSDGLFVAISVPRDVIMAEAQHLLRVDLAALLVMTAFGMVCAWWAGGRLVVRPAKAILQQAQEVVSGNLAARIPGVFAGGDELGHIARTFNQMAASLQERRVELDLALGHIGKEHDQLQLIINSMSEGVIAVDLHGGFLLFNATARTIFPEIEAHDSVASWRQKHQLLTLDGKTAYTEGDRPLSRAIKGEEVDDWDVLLRVEGEHDRILRMNLRPLRDPQRTLLGGLVVFTDITERKATEEFVRAQEQVLELIATGVPLGLSLEAVVRLVEASSSQSLCTILLVEGGHLRHAAAVRMPAEFCREIDFLPIGPGVGACGTAAFLRQPVMVVDAETDPLMKDYREVLQRYGIKACWSTPVLSSTGEVIATFAIYSMTPRQPQKRDLALVDTAVRLTRIALEKHGAEAALLGSEARFRELAENVEDVFYNRDAGTGRVLYVSPAYASLWGKSCESLYADPLSYLEAVHPDDRGTALVADRANQAGQSSD
ncbi:MAG: cache domain-containing protein, partial [Polaromonas sp.]